ncbi:MAG: hypothetical protein Ct9H300mP19_19110 [Dehalococcoidia bacterium]|nr:MAG: hypothetical protein Ct9H300mP19_19110 [Dehalococcoidia bacterium]
MASASVVFPEPDSPTIAIVGPCWTDNETPSTARNCGLHQKTPGSLKIKGELPHHEALASRLLQALADSLLVTRSQHAAFCVLVKFVSQVSLANKHHAPNHIVEQTYNHQSQNQKGRHHPGNLLQKRSSDVTLSSKCGTHAINPRVKDAVVATESLLRDHLRSYDRRT